MPKISVVIPVYNTEEYLEQCLDSVLGQTLQDVEVICVDDCSRDGSYRIMEAYHARDPRVKIFRFNESKSALQARKTGVIASEGEYILFLDADDYLEPDACRKLYDKITREKVDILHFSSRVVNCANLPQGRIDSNQKLLTPYEGRIDGSDVFTACFAKKKYFFTLWNKLMKAELVKKAFSCMEDRYLPKAQDLYSFFVISYFAKSYKGWVTEPLHNYCMGRGVVGSSSMNPDKFERYCTQVNIVDALRRFSKEYNILDKTEEIIEKYHTQWLEECVRLWKNELPMEYAVEGWDILCRYWGCKNVIGAMAKLFWYQRTDIARKLKDMPHLSLKGREIKTIAIYYYHFTTGGVQRVINLLTTMFVKLGYKVVIITDSEESEEDFPLPAGAVRTTILSRDKINNTCFADRLVSWDKLREEYGFDMVFYHAWTSNVMLWDFLYLKNCNIPVIAHAHSVYSFAVNKMQKLFPEITRILPVADGMVVLSDADKAFWDAYTYPVYSIPNPAAEELKQANAAAFENKALVWVGRVSDEKQPKALFTIMERVVRSVPDTKLYLVGNFDDPQWPALTTQMGLEDHIVFCGMTQDVMQHYEKASVHIATSKYEGFLMTLLESQAHSLPTVMFKMPNLTIGTEECGVIGVDMMNCNAAADEIIKLLTKREYWDRFSQRARASYERLSAYDYEGAWSDVIAGDDEPAIIDEAVKNMIYTFVNHYEEGLKFLESQQKQKNKQVQMVLKDTGELDVAAYKIGRIITFFPRKIKGFVRCCKDHGVGYTFKRALHKIRRIIRK